MDKNIGENSVSGCAVIYIIFQEDPFLANNCKNHILRAAHANIIFFQSIPPWPQNSEKQHILKLGSWWQLSTKSQLFWNILVLKWITNAPRSLESHETLSRQRCSFAVITDGLNGPPEPHLTNIVVAILPIMLLCSAKLFLKSAEYLESNMVGFIQLESWIWDEFRPKNWFSDDNTYEKLSETVK